VFRLCPHYTEFCRLVNTVHATEKDFHKVVNLVHKPFSNKKIFHISLDLPGNHGYC
jgi:hypothetical protein